MMGGLPSKSGPLSEGSFARRRFSPTPRATGAREETSAPALVAMPRDIIDDTVRMANGSHYGLTPFAWSRDIGQALRIAHRVEAGWVRVNQGMGQVLGQSCGGVKQSGIGREFSLEYDL